METRGTVDGIDVIVEIERGWGIETEVGRRNQKYAVRDRTVIETNIRLEVEGIVEIKGIWIVVYLVVIING